jgi:hypothetical protein
MKTKSKKKTTPVADAYQAGVARGKREVEAVTVEMEAVLGRCEQLEQLRQNRRRVARATAMRAVHSMVRAFEERQGSYSKDTAMEIEMRDVEYNRLADTAQDPQAVTWWQGFNRALAYVSIEMRALQFVEVQETLVAGRIVEAAGAAYLTAVMDFPEELEAFAGAYAIEERFASFVRLFGGVNA